MKKLTLENAFDIDECAILEIKSLPGVEGCTTTIEGTTVVAALKGLALLVEEVAKVMHVPTEHVLCQITTILLAPKAEEEGHE